MTAIVTPVVRGAAARRDRAWLRSFVQLGARAMLDGVTPSDVERQEDTVLRALALLDQQPGVMLADEVGMGKTFEALGVVAAFRHERPDARVLILTPGPDLNAKWKQEIERFSDPEHPIYDFGRDVEAVTKLVDLAAGATRARIVVAPVSAFTSTRGGEDQAYLLSLFVYWLRSIDRDVDGRTVSAIMRRFREGYLDGGRVDVRWERFLGLFPFEQVEPCLAGVFRAQASGGGDGEGDEKTPGLFELYDQQGLAAFADDEQGVRRALDLARFRLLRKLLPPFDLLVVDEAHKLKNSATVRYQAVTALLTRRFDKALFLTATPFQLDVAELAQVFRLFSLARRAPLDDLRQQADQLLDGVRAYQEAYTAFEAVWRRLDAAAADRFRQLYERDPDVATCPDDPILDTVARRLAALRQLKRERVEPSFRRWMIRSIRRDRRAYRRHKAQLLVPSGAQALPFLLGERLIAELFRTGDGTHKPAAQVSLVSSFAAARRGALLGDGGRAMGAEAEEYRALLRRVLHKARRNGDHPKLAAVLADAIAQAERGEKTLVFCARLETLSELAAEIRAAWLERMRDRWKVVLPRARRDEIFDDAPSTTAAAGDGSPTRAKGRHTLLQARFHRAQDALYLALREPYLRSALDIADWTVAHAAAVAKDAQEALERLRVGRTSAERHDYRLVKRCVEQAAAARWQLAEASRAERARVPTDLLGALTDERYVEAGLDLQRDAGGEDDPEAGAWRVRWRITSADVRLVAGSARSLWARLQSHLRPLDQHTRVRLVEQVARFLTFKEVGFLVDLLREAKAAGGLRVDPVESKPLLKYLDAFWDTPTGSAWLARLAGFVRYFASRDVAQRRDILEGPIRTGDVVRQTRDGESRERLREAFNTPLYPMILLANEVMQEGLDLHRHCARVVHYDLAWNPAQLEQRVGRVDRIGSWTAQRLERDPAATLDVLYPLIARTIDVRMYRRVKQREKWLEFLLGATPTFREDLIEDEDVPELPPGLAASLAIDLGPPRSA